ncbi:MAG TPA: DUF1232 domain-containing protein [Alphaproteobacteria bacterium]|nr:DUF1232 domain-containing protein [Alphaproteobacteria bacterium]
MEKSYIDTIRDKFQDLKDSNEELDKELLYFPELIQLLCDMLDNDIVDKDSRILINAALGYLIVANDIVPEDVYGPYGYMDDMYVACIVLGKLKSNYPDLINRLWNNDVSFSKVLEDCTYKSEKFLDEKNLKERLLRYCGLSD